jgi:Abortive infection alpha
LVKDSNSAQSPQYRNATTSASEGGLSTLAAAAGETDEELGDLWARLLVASMNPDRSKRVRLRFVDALEQMDPLDAVLLKWINQNSGGRVDAAARVAAMKELNLTSDEVETSFTNFANVGFSEGEELTPLGREFIGVVMNN